MPKRLLSSGRTSPHRGSLDNLRENRCKGRPVIAMISMPMLARGGLVVSADHGVCLEWHCVNDVVRRVLT